MQAQLVEITTDEGEFQLCDVRCRRQSGHQSKTSKGLLLTQSGHSTSHGSVLKNAYHRLTRRGGTSEEALMTNCYTTRVRGAFNSRG